MLNHGAKCFAHLLGFFAVRFCETVTTPAAVASSSRNSSILAERVSLSCANSCVIASNAVLNTGVDVWAFHLAALLPYSFRHVPSIHLYDFFELLSILSSAGDVFLGWLALSAAGGLAVLQSGDAGVMGGYPVDGWAWVSVIIGMTS